MTLWVTALAVLAAAALLLQMVVIGRLRADRARLRRALEIHQVTEADSALSTSALDVWPGD